MNYAWDFVASSRKAHCFDARSRERLTRSLCGRWGIIAMQPSRMEPETGKRTDDDCAACVKALTAATQRATPTRPAEGAER